MEDFKCKQLNNKYLFERKQEEDELIHNLLEAIKYVERRIKECEKYGEHYISRHSTNLQCIMNENSSVSGYDGESFNDRIKQLLLYREEYVDALYFPFGKYKGRIVQDVLKEDKSYCKWFSENIIGKDYNTLKILDFLHKKLEDLPYIDKDRKQELNRILKDYVPQEWQKDIVKEKLLTTNKYYGSSSNYDDSYYDDPNDWMSDVIDYGDLC